MLCDVLSIVPWWHAVLCDVLSSAVVARHVV